MSVAQSQRLIILKKSKYGESDLILHGLNRFGARMGFIAKGAIKSRRRFGGGVLDPLQYVEFHFNPARSSSNSNSGGLLFLTEASVVDGFPRLRRDLAKLELGLQFLQWVFDLSVENENPDLFNLLGNSLKALESEECALETLRLQFLCKLLWSQGILPAEEDYSRLALVPVHEGASLKFSSLQRHQLQKDLEFRLADFMQR